MQINTSLVEEVREFATQLLAKKIPDKMTYHCLDHTRSVVSAALQIGAGSGLSEHELEVLEVAAWFHDMGYIKGQENHEEESARLAEAFLRERSIDNAFTAQVERLILATRMPQQPKSLIEEVICDADLAHLAMDGFEKRSDLLRQEISALYGKEISEVAWLEKNLSFVGNHKYFTEYAKKHLQEKTEENLRMIKKKLKRAHKNEDEVKKLEDKVADLKKKLDKSQELTPTRGIETMFRLTSKNHLDLSSMADTKANIMISVNSIILSILVSVLFRKLDEYQYMLVPAVIMTAVCLTTIVFAILATRPNVSSGTFTKDDIRNKKTNLLFFGNFHQMTREDYEWGMREMMKDGDYLYGSLINDIYYLGVVLGKKYRLLHISYTIFMFGFVISVLSFLIAEVYFKTSAY